MISDPLLNDGGFFYLTNILSGYVFSPGLSSRRGTAVPARCSSATETAETIRVE